MAGGTVARPLRRAQPTSTSMPTKFAGDDRQAAECSTLRSQQTAVARSNVFAALLREPDADREPRVVRREAPDPHLNHVSRSR
jgi:hypothetical protein